MIGTHRTTIQSHPDGFEVRYHETVVVSVRGGRITLNTGGYFSSTTKRRMNQALATIAPGYSVYQRKKAWYVGRNDEPAIPFEGEGVVIIKVGDRFVKEDA